MAWKCYYYAVAFGCALLCSDGQLQAQSADALIDKLVEKGILTVKEANELREETDKNFSQAYSVKSGMPDWITSLRFNGDLRLRFDRIATDDTAFEERNRFRYRLRFGYTAVLKDNWEVGIGLTSSEQAGRDASAADPISNNQSFGDNASKKAIAIDKVYVKWTPVNNALWAATTLLGKMENPIVFPSTILFDKDYTPEGLAQEFQLKFNDQQSVKLLGTAYILDEIGVSTDDPYLFAGQLRWDANWSPKLQSSIGAALLAIVNQEALTNGAVPDVGAGNTRIPPTGILANSFESFYADATITYVLDSFPGYNAPFPISFAADFLHNFSADDNHLGYSVGVNIGRAAKKGLWEFNYRYTELQADAWYEEFVESDFGGFYKFAPPGAPGTGYRSGTNLRGHYFRGTYNFYDSLSFTIAYYLTDLIHEPAGEAYDSGTGRLFVEAVWKY